MIDDDVPHRTATGARPNKALHRACGRLHARRIPLLYTRALGAFALTQVMHGHKWAMLPSEA
eukprot:5265736-Prymnesium_polylepis.1